MTISYYLNTDNADSLNTVVLVTTIQKQKVQQILDYCTILPFTHPKFNYIPPQVVGQAGSIVAIRSRKPTDFVFTITAVSDEQKDETINSLTILGLYPAPLKAGAFEIFHPSLSSCSIQKILITEIKQPTWKVGPMVWEFKCIEGGKPRPFTQLTAEVVRLANEQQGTVSTSIDAAKKGRKQ